MDELYPEFGQYDLFNKHFDRALKLNVTAAVTPTCRHEYTEVKTIDDNGNERVCTICGQVALTDITEFDKLSGCLEGEDFLKVRYGPGTPPPLQSFLLPTIITKKELLTYHMKMRDKFVDTVHLQKTRRYTDIQRICQQFNIPNDYAIEAMRRLLCAKKNLHSRYKPVELIIELIKDDPALSNRVPMLRKMTKEGQRIEKYLNDIKELKRELAKERRKNKLVLH